MTQILIKGESVYQCDVCSRKIRVLTSRTGIDVVQRCTITYGCRGRLHQLRDAKEINSTPAFPSEVAGVQDWFQRRVEYTHTQQIGTKTWTINHELANKPLVYAYVLKQTEASETVSVTAPTGTYWYKHTSGADANNPTAPTAAGLYVFNGVRWVVPQDVIPVGLVGTSVFEYMVLTKPVSVRTVDSNTTELTFPDNVSGIAQCIALASQNTSNPIRAKVVDKTSPFKLTNGGEITIATASENPFISVAINFKSSTIRTGINVTFNNVDNTASVASPWVSVGKVYVNGKTYTVRSFNMVTTPPVPGIMASGNIDPSSARFTFENFSSAINENLILLGTPPYLTVDRVYDRFVDIASIDKFSPEIYYNDGEVYIEQSNIRSVYPLINTVD